MFRICLLVLVASSAVLAFPDGLCDSDCRLRLHERMLEEERIRIEVEREMEEERRRKEEEERIKQENLLLNANQVFVDAKPGFESQPVVLTPMVLPESSLLENKEPQVIFTGSPTVLAPINRVETPQTLILPATDGKPSVMWTTSPIIESKPTFVETKPTFVEEKPLFIETKPTFVEEKPLFVENKPLFESAPVMMVMRPEDKPAEGVFNRVEVALPEKKEPEFEFNKKPEFEFNKKPESEFDKKPESEFNKKPEEKEPEYGWTEKKEEDVKKPEEFRSIPVFRNRVGVVKSTSDSVVVEHPTVRYVSPQVVSTIGARSGYSNLGYSIVNQPIYSSWVAPSAAVVPATRSYYTVPSVRTYSSVQVPTIYQVAK